MHTDPRPSYPDLVDPLFWDCYFAWRETNLLSVERLFALYGVTSVPSTCRPSGC